MKLENLTKLQKVAIESELSVMLTFSHSPADLKVKIYRILSDVVSEFRNIIVEVIKNIVTLDESEIDNLNFLAQTKSVPVSLWVDKTIEDINYHLNAPDVSYRLNKLPLNKKKIKENLLESAFIIFARKAILVSPVAVKELLTRILENDNLQFLKTTCLYLYSGCQEIQEFKCCSKEVSEEILKCEIDPYALMSFTTESECLDKINQNNSYEALEDEEAPSESEEHPIIEIKQIKLGKGTESMSKEELSQILGNQILDIVNNLYSTKKESKDNELCYVVQKKFKNTNIKQNLEKFKSKEEAQEFIDKIKEERPELSTTCEFVICKQIIKN